ncbi:MAG: CYTH domain-containing protein [Mangrovibacterium sp.]
MGIEIERKFILKEGFEPNGIKQIRIAQAYLNDNLNTTVRIRLADDKAYLTIKGKTVGISRSEFEYEIPFEDAKQLMRLSENSPIEKIRHIYMYEGKKWEVDVFSGDNEGLIVAECELSSEDEIISLPEWVECEVSGDPKYHNSSLVKCPYKIWNSQ